MTHLGMMNSGDVNFGSAPGPNGNSLEAATVGGVNRRAWATARSSIEQNLGLDRKGKAGGEAQSQQSRWQAQFAAVTAEMRKLSLDGSRDESSEVGVDQVTKRAGTGDAGHSRKIDRKVETDSGGTGLNDANPAQVLLAPAGSLQVGIERLKSGLYLGLDPAFGLDRTFGLRLNVAENPISGRVDKHGPESLLSKRLSSQRDAAGKTVDTPEQGATRNPRQPASVSGLAIQTEAVRRNSQGTVEISRPVSLSSKQQSRSSSVNVTGSRKHTGGDAEKEKSTGIPFVLLSIAPVVASRGSILATENDFVSRTSGKDKPQAVRQSGTVVAEEAAQSIDRVIGLTTSATREVVESRGFSADQTREERARTPDLLFGAASSAEVEGGSITARGISQDSDISPHPDINLLGNAEVPLPPIPVTSIHRAEANISPNRAIGEVSPGSAVKAEFTPSAAIDSQSFQDRIPHSLSRVSRMNSPSQECANPTGGLPYQIFEFGDAAKSSTAIQSVPIGAVPLPVDTGAAPDNREGVAESAPQIRHSGIIAGQVGSGLPRGVYQSANSLGSLGELSARAEEKQRTAGQADFARTLETPQHSSAMSLSGAGGMRGLESSRDATNQSESSMREVDLSVKTSALSSGAGFLTESAIANFPGSESPENPMFDVPMLKSAESAMSGGPTEMGESVEERSSTFATPQKSTLAAFRGSVVSGNPRQTTDSNLDVSATKVDGVRLGAHQELGERARFARIPHATNSAEASHDAQPDRIKQASNQASNQAAGGDSRLKAPWHLDGSAGTPYALSFVGVSTAGAGISLAQPQGLRHSDVQANDLPGAPAAGEQDAFAKINPFEAMDEGNPVISPATSSGGPHELVAGYRDGSLGYVEVRAHLEGNAVHASLIPQSTASGTELEKQLPSLSGWLNDHNTVVERLMVQKDPPSGGSDQHSRSQPEFDRPNPNRPDSNRDDLDRQSHGRQAPQDGEQYPHSGHLKPGAIIPDDPSAISLHSSKMPDRDQILRSDQSTGESATSTRQHKGLARYELSADADDGAKWLLGPPLLNGGNISVMA